MTDPTLVRALRDGVMVSRVRGTRTYAYVGRKVPKGWKELPGGIHLGRGIWLLRVEPKEDPR